MRGLLSYHFLRWFAGDLKNRGDQTVSILNDQTNESDGDLTSGPNFPADKEVLANRLPDENDLQNKEELNQKNETQIRNVREQRSREELNNY